ncbi:MAG: cytochrome P450 [Gammaproteobacteria bacterium]|nr:MAG: cytochrome P450 [Gammaproteobacteria bacterium]
MNFIPVMPRPLKKDPGPLTILNKARNDLLSFWPEDAYRFQFARRKIINRWMFIANSPDTVEHVLVTHNDIYERKSPYMRKALEPLLGDGLFISDGETWRQRRELQAPVFHSRNLKPFTETMSTCVMEMAAEWESKYVDQRLLVLPEMAKLTSEIISRTMFGDELGSKNAGAIVSGFTDYQAVIEKFDLSSFFGLPEWLPKMPHRRRGLKVVNRVHEIFDDILIRNMEKKDMQSTLLSRLLDAYDPTSKDGITLEQIRNEAIVIFMAGHETTANALAWAWYLLSNQPSVLEKLHKELHQVLGSRPPKYEDVSKLKYTRAIFEESMRLYPPVPILSRQSSQEDVIRKKKIPPGSIMLVVPWLLHRHEQLWDRPHEFIPERFTSEWPTRRQKYSYIPFSAGPRICLGAAFGLTEAILCLATLAQRFTLEPVPGYKVGYECRLTLRPKDGLPLILRSRNR